MKTITGQSNIGLIFCEKNSSKQTIIRGSIYVQICSYDGLCESLYRECIVNMQCGILVGCCMVYMQQVTAAVVVPFTPHEKKIREYLLTQTPLPQALFGIILAYTNEYYAVTVFKTIAAESVASFSNNGRLIATAGRSGLVALWDAYTKANIKVFQAHYAPVSALSFNADDTLMATGGHDHVTRIWDISSGKRLSLLQGHTRYINAVSFSPDGKRLTTASDDQTIRFWDVETSAMLFTLHQHTDFVCSAAFSSDGKQLVSAGNDMRAYIWDTRSQEVVRQLLAHEDDVNSASFNTSNDEVVTGSRDSTVRTWDVRKAEVKAVARFSNPIRSAYFNSDSKQILAAGTGTQAYVFDARTQEVIQTLDTRAKFLYSASFGLHDEHVLTAGSDRVMLWSLLYGAYQKSSLSYLEKDK